LDGGRRAHENVAMTERLSPAWRGGVSSDYEELLLRELYDEHAGWLVGLVLRLTDGDVLRAEDIVQETIVRAWRNAHILTANDGRSLRPWLVTMARRIALDDYRSDIDHSPVMYDDRGPGGDEPDRVVDSVAMSDALRALTQAHREILVETYFNGRTVAEAARALAIPLGTAKSRVHHALRALRDSLERRGMVREYGA
jgi:RNA polymerase sigma-70 factor (ECF subfamily)